MEERLKKNKKKTTELALEGLPHASLRMSHAPLHIKPCTPRMDMAGNYSLLVFQAVFRGKPYFHHLNP